MKIYPLSNVNLEPLKFHFRDLEWLSPRSFNNYMTDIMDPSSPLITNGDVDIAFLHLDFEEFIKTNEDIDSLLEALNDVSQKTKATFLLSTFFASPYNTSTYTFQELDIEMLYNRKILEFARNNNAIVFDFKSFVSLYGYNQIYNDKFWYLGRIRYTQEALGNMAEALEHELSRYKTPAKKALVLDLDNTLWGGIVGEEEIELSNEGTGKIYLDFQKNIKRLKSLGVLLAINSKNNMSDALKGLSHPLSQLSPDDFAMIQANWRDKSSNLADIAASLDIGLDSLVFIDDNIIERESVKTMLPDVVVPDFPEEIYAINSWFVSDVVYNNFHKFFITDEDKRKHTQYRARVERSQLISKMSYQEFLESLDINLSFLVDNPDFIQRYAQMTQKTNQFNLTTKRYTTKDMESFMIDATHSVVAVDYQDRFLHEGIVGLAILRHTNTQETHIDTFLLSCRILNRGVEKELLGKIEEIASTKNSHAIIGYYLPTDRNSQVASFYPSHGFDPHGEGIFIKRVEKTIDNRPFKNTPSKKRTLS